MKKYVVSTKTIINIFVATSLAVYLFIYIYKYEIGVLKDYYLFFDRTDRFADILKVIFSFKDVFSVQELFNLGVPQVWVNSNPYNNIIEGSSSSTLLMILPPITIIFVKITALFAKFIGINYLSILILYVSVLTSFIIYIFFNQLKNDKKLIFILFSFPFLFLIDRGNIMSGISALCLYVVFKKFYLNKEFNNFDLVFFLVACSMRPNYLVFGLLFLFKKDFLSNFIEILKVSISYIVLNGFCFVVANVFLNNYTIKNFIIANDYYFNSTIRFVPWNSSMYGAVYNLYMSNFENIKGIKSKEVIELIDRIVISSDLVRVIILGYLFVIIFAYWKCINKNISRQSFLIITSSACALLTSPFTDYHLIIFALLTLLFLDNVKNINLRKISLILLLILLLPKLHASSPLFNYSNFINSFTLNVLILIHLFTKQDSYYFQKD